MLSICASSSSTGTVDGRLVVTGAGTLAVSVGEAWRVLLLRNQMMLMANSNIAAKASRLPPVAHRRGLRTAAGGRNRTVPAGGRTNPSRSRAPRIPLQTRGLGSCIGSSNLPASAIYRRSCTRSEHTGQERRWASSSAFPPISMMLGRSLWNSAQFIATTLSPHTLARVLPASVSGGLFGSVHSEQVSQFHSGLVQLRLAVADRATHHLRDLVVL